MKNKTGSLSAATYAPFQTTIQEILSIYPDSSENLEFSLNNNNMAISLFSFGGSDRSLWITLGQKRNKLEIKYSYYYTVDLLIDQREQITRTSTGKARFYFSTADELKEYAPAILAIYDYREREAKGRLFDCCHKYMECSDAQQCTHSDLDTAMSCTYRRKLKQGKIFYGINRNID